MPKDHIPIMLKGPEGHRLSDMSGVLHDLRTTAGMLAHLFREINANQSFSTAAQALFDSAIIHYGRCFSGGVRHAFKEIREWAESLPDGLSHIHQEALVLRDKHVAHSVNDWELNLPVVYISVDMETDETAISQISVANQSILTPGRDWLEALRTVAVRLADQTEKAIEDEKARLFAIAQEKTPDYWRKRIGSEAWMFPGKLAPNDKRRGRS